MSLTQTEIPVPRRIVVDGRDADVIEVWIDHEEGFGGYDYRFDGERVVHWIKGNSPRLGGKAS